MKLDTNAYVYWLRPDGKIASTRLINLLSESFQGTDLFTTKESVKITAGQIPKP